MSDTPQAGAVYARIIRAQKRGLGVHLSADEVAAFLADDAVIMAALGGDGSDGSGPPEWLTPMERRRFIDPDCMTYDNVFEPRRSPS